MNSIRQVSTLIRRLRFLLVWIQDLLNFYQQHLELKMVMSRSLSHAFGSVVRSILVGIFELGIEEVMVIGHTDCGVQHINSEMMIGHMMERGIDEEKIELIRHCGVDFDTWLEGFDCVESSVRDSVEMLRKHPLIPKDVKISGYVMDSVTGELKVVEP